MMKNKIIILLAIILFTSCKKEQSENIGYPVYYTIYSEKNNCHFKYADSKSNWHDTTIANNTAIVITSQIESNYDLAAQLSFNGSDSLYLKAECNNKKAEKAFRNISGHLTITIQLSELK